jgi:hypothetical protein
MAALCCLLVWLVITRKRQLATICYKIIKRPLVKKCDC